MTASADEDKPPATDADLCEILEKPVSKDDQLRMLQNMSGADCEIVTGVSIGEPTTTLAGEGRLGRGWRADV